MPGANYNTTNALFQFPNCRFRDLAPEPEVQSEAMPAALWTLVRERLAEQSRHV